MATTFQSFFCQTRLSVCLAFVVGLVPLHAQIWNGFKFSLKETDRLDWQVKTGLRTQNSFGDVFDRRVGTVVTTPVGAGIRLSAGYLFRNKDRFERDTDFDHRFIGGVSYPLANRFLKIKGTTLYERHVGVRDTPAFNRYRQRFEIERRRKGASPFFYEDLTFKREGFVRSRTRVGLRWRLETGHTIGFSYQFDSSRRGAAWAPRHAIYTEFELGSPGWIERARRN